MEEISDAAINIDNLSLSRKLGGNSLRFSLKDDRIGIEQEFDFTIASAKSSDHGQEKINAGNYAMNVDSEKTHPVLVIDKVRASQGMSTACIVIDFHAESESQTGIIYLLLIKGHTNVH